MLKKEKIRYSFATYKQKKGEDPCVDLTEVAGILASGVGKIPERLNLTRATELFHLGRAFLAMEKELIEYDNQKQKDK